MGICTRKTMMGLLSLLISFGAASTGIADSPMFWPADRHFMANDGDTPRNGKPVAGDFDGDGDLDVGLEYGQTFKFFANNGDGSFVLAGSNDEMGGYVSAVADFDGDGNMDIALAAGTIEVYRNEGNFKFSFQASLAGGSNFRAGDIDGDGDTDLVAAGGNTGCQIRVFRNTGNGTFVAEGYDQSGSDNGKLTLGDFDGDGDLDAAKRGGPYPGGTVYRNDGAAGFVATGSTGLAMSFLESGDFDGDGDIDLAGTVQQSETYFDGTYWRTRTFESIQLSLNDGAGVFVPGSATALPEFPQDWRGIHVDDITVADFNNDGMTDIAVHAHNYAQYVLTASGDGGFTVRIENSFGCGSPNITSGDADGDGDIDLIMADGSSCGAWAVLKNNGDGTFAGAPRYLVIGDSMEYLSLALGDFNNDGKTDIAVGRTNKTVMLAYNIGGRGIVEGPSYAVADAQDILAADLDGDGDLDLATNGVDVLLNNGDGTFAEAVNYASGTGRDSYVNAADLDRDGDLDLATSAGEVFYNDGYGSFGTSAVNPANWIEALADFNGDGYSDAAGWFRSAADNKWYFGVAMNDGTGGFLAPVIIPGVDPYYISVADVDNDGDIDIGASNDDTTLGGGTALTIVLNDGAGNFTVKGKYDVIDEGYADPFAQTTGDFNGDGAVDFAFINCYHTIVIALNNGDGSYRSGGYYSGVCGMADVAAGDLDGDGAVDIIALEDYYTSAIHVLYNNIPVELPIRPQVEMILGMIADMRANGITADGASQILAELAELDALIQTAVEVGRVDQGKGKGMLASADAAAASMERAAAAKGKSAGNMLVAASNQLEALLNMLDAVERK